MKCRHCGVTIFGTMNAWFATMAVPSPNTVIHVTDCCEGKLGQYHEPYTMEQLGRQLADGVNDLDV